MSQVNDSNIPAIRGVPLTNTNKLLTRCPNNLLGALICHHPKPHVAATSRSTEPNAVHPPSAARVFVTTISSIVRSSPSVTPMESTPPERSSSPFLKMRTPFNPSFAKSCRWSSKKESNGKPPACCYPLQIASSNLKRMELEKPQPEQVVIDVVQPLKYEPPIAAPELTEEEAKEASAHAQSDNAQADNAQPLKP